MALQASRTHGVRTRVFGYLFAATAFCAVLAGCQAVKVSSATYTPLAASVHAQQIQLKEPVTVVLSNESTATLQGGSQWIQVGTLPEGNVYKPTAGAFMVNARRVRESWIVVSNDAVAGFYFPGEALYTKAVHSTSLVLEKK